MAISNAIGAEIITRVVGYVLKKGNFAESSPNLPQRILVLGEANNANQGSLVLTKKQITSARQAGDLYGYGSPIHMQMRILFPSSGQGVGGIPVIVAPQAEAVGAAAKVITISPVGVATGNGTHFLYIAGRNQVDGGVYSINIVTGDTVATISAKIRDVINSVLGSPVSAVADSYKATATTKWKGLTADGVTIRVDRGDNTLGVSYVIATTANGSGTPSIQGGLDQIGNEWVTIVSNGYGTQSTTLDLLEAFNGIALDANPTGRYGGTVFKPFIAVSGSTSDDASAITDARKAQMTIALGVAPLSEGLPLEASANYTYLFANQAQNNPHLDIAGQTLPDMPTPLTIGSMETLANRNAIVLKGSSTVVLNAGLYQVQDFVTTYHPVGEVPPAFRYARNLNLDWNVRYGYLLLEELYVVDHAIAGDDDIVEVNDVIKPKDWKGVLFAYAEDLESRALITDSDFMTDSIQVGLSTVNPDRMETFFRYKRTGFARQSATDAQAGFNFGTTN